MEKRDAAFLHGVDAFCKEAGFDDDDRVALFALLDKAAAGPWATEDLEAPDPNSDTNPDTNSWGYGAGKTLRDWTSGVGNAVSSPFRNFFGGLSGYKKYVPPTSAELDETAHKSDAKALEAFRNEMKRNNLSAPAALRRVQGLQNNRNVTDLIQNTPEYQEALRTGHMGYMEGVPASSFSRSKPNGNAPAAAPQPNITTSSPSGPAPSSPASQPGGRYGLQSVTAPGTLPADYHPPAVNPQPPAPPAPPGQPQPEHPPWADLSRAYRTGKDRTLDAGAHITDPSLNPIVPEPPRTPKPNGISSGTGLNYDRMSNNGITYGADLRLLDQERDANQRAGYGYTRTENIDKAREDKARTVGSTPLTTGAPPPPAPPTANPGLQPSPQLQSLMPKQPGAPAAPNQDSVFKMTQGAGGRGAISGQQSTQYGLPSGGGAPSLKNVLSTYKAPNPGSSEITSGKDDAYSPPSPPTPPKPPGPPVAGGPQERAKFNPQPGDE